ncbi:MAG: SDR family oxidoreductase, partial [Candidatus Omnitrophica bacterium]|nr:SDR family oxidoreductase [Candidatus Omnitrophota bacterium]
NTQWLPGDVSLPDCGVSGQTIQTLTGAIDGIYHSAGITRLDQKYPEKTHLTNTEGTKNVFELAVKLATPDFYHISTAYVAGTSDKPLAADMLDCGQSFRNPYEASKLNAEKYLNQMRSETGIRIHIYRPSIVVGHSDDLNCSYGGTVYAYLKALIFLKALTERDDRKNQSFQKEYGVRKEEKNIWNIPIRIEGAGGAKVNLVDVRQIAGILAVHRSLTPEKGMTYDVLGPENYTLTELRDAFCEALSIRGPEFASAESFSKKPANHLETKFSKMTREFRPYLFSQPRFSPQPSPEMLPVDLKRLASDFEKIFWIYRKDNEKSGLAQMALEVMQIKNSQAYLDYFAAGDIGQGFMKKINHVQTCVAFRISGEESSVRVFEFNRGKVTEITSDVLPADVVCTYEMNETIFNRIVNGEADARETFFKGLLKITGDQAVGLQLGYAFTDYFRNLSDRVHEEIECK